MKILQAASEVVPFAKTGGLADVVGALPLALENVGQELIISMPCYKEVVDSGVKLERLSKDISYTAIGKNLKVYFIEKKEYYYRQGLYGTKQGDHKDNLERFSYYCKRTLKLLKEIDFSPDIIHLHDWQACLISVYLKNLYKNDTFFKNTKTILTIHNIGYQGLFPKREFPKLGLSADLFNIEGLEFYGKIGLLKGGIVFSDIINTVSPTYSKEIQTGKFGFGLEGILRKRKADVFGILNGLDYSHWNPKTDKFIAKKYSLDHLDNKYVNKGNLRKICKLPVIKDVPLFGIVSRLAEQKGFDILSEAMDNICKMRLQLVILGTGEERYHRLLKKFANKYPKVISLHLKFDNSLAHKIYAGSDIFVMPSKYEPCGLGQLISFKYGTIPLVFKTGGLADTVNKQNGFIFSDYTKEALINTVKKALKAYKNKDEWMRLIKKAMQYNFSWGEAARKYLELYAKAQSK